METSEDPNPRLGVHDKRQLFYTLMAMIERLFFLNKFPVDLENFALSMQTEEIEAAWILLSADGTERSLSPRKTQVFSCNNINWTMHVYPDEAQSNKGGVIFMNVTGTADISDARRHQDAVSTWCVRQARLEDQLLRAIKVIKAVVHSCNTVGQYKRVSPDLLTFLPDKYKLALRDYTKQSPYPAITVEPEEIDTTLSTLAFAALQPTHSSEENYIRGSHWRGRCYNLDSFSRSDEYLGQEVRRLHL